MEIENGFDKKLIEWLDNIIGVPTKELGLFIADRVQRWRITQAQNTISKARAKCLELNLPLKMISPKLICPFLEECSLEDDDYMQDKWANMLVHMLNSEKNVQSKIFPFILGQMSKEEFLELEQHFLEVYEGINEMDISYNTIDENYERINKLYKDSGEGKEDNEYYSELTRLANSLYEIFEHRKACLTLYNIELREYEMANLIRLGVVETVPVSYVSNGPLKYDGEMRYDGQVKVHHDRYDYRISPLGEILLRVCLDFNKKTPQNNL